MASHEPRARRALNAHFSRFQLHQLWVDVNVEARSNKCLENASERITWSCYCMFPCSNGLVCLSNRLFPCSSVHVCRSYLPGCRGTAAGSGPAPTRSTALLLRWPGRAAVRSSSRYILPWFRCSLAGSLWERAHRWPSIVRCSRCTKIP